MIVAADGGTLNVMNNRAPSNRDSNVAPPFNRTSFIPVGNTPSTNGGGGFKLDRWKSMSMCMTVTEDD